ncbi:MAG: DUF2156 domain-containing protein [Planctomycetaceae bacterium]
MERQSASLAQEPAATAKPYRVPPWQLDPGAALLHRDQLAAEQREALTKLAFQHGEAADSYFATEDEGHCLMTPDLSAGVAVFKHSRFWHIPGGILSSPEDRPEVISWLKSIAEKQRVTVAVYSVGKEDVPLFAERGFEINKWGEEPVLDLGSIDWKGSDFSWMRRQTSFCQRHGLIAREVFPDQEAPERRAQIESELWEILHADLKGRAYPKPLRMLEGQFAPHALFHRRLFVAENPAEKRIESFVVCNPMRGGREWAIETYRRRPDSVRGAVPFLMRSIVDLFQSEGIERISLCIVPGRGCETVSNDRENWMVRRSMQLWYHRLGPLFNAKGQDYFKQKFRPRFQERFICVSPKSSLRSLSSFMWTTGGLMPHPWNLVKAFWRSLRRGHDQH